MSKQWRVKEGRLIHDGDCHFFGKKICTCGLLHYLVESLPTDGGEWFSEEMAYHESQIDRVPRPEPLP